MKHHNFIGGIIVLLALVISLAGTVMSEDGKGEDVGGVKRSAPNKNDSNSLNSLSPLNGCTGGNLLRIFKHSINHNL